MQRGTGTGYPARYCGILYGSSTRSIAITLGIEESEAQSIINSYFQVYPRIKNFVENSHKMAASNFFVYSPFGQRKYEYGAMPIYKRTAVYNAALRNSQNVRIQGPASTLGLMAFSKVDEELRAAGIGGAMCTVYDSIEAYVKIENIAEAIELSFYAMDDWPVETYDWLDLPIGADAEIGFNWGEGLSKVWRGITQKECLEILGV